MEHTLTVDTVVSVRDDLLASDLSETEMVMMHIDKGYYYGVEEVAKVIWDALAEPKSVGELCELVQHHYEVEPETVGPDVLAFLGDLLNEELIRVHDDRRSPSSS